MTITKELKNSFILFCQQEFHLKSYCANENNKNQWFFVQAGKTFGNKLHYEFGGNKIQLHIELHAGSDIQKYLTQKPISADYEWDKWQKKNNHRCILERNVSNDEDIFNAFREISKYFEPLIEEFESNQNRVNPINSIIVEESNNNIELNTETLENSIVSVPINFELGTGHNNLQNGNEKEKQIDKKKKIANAVTVSELIKTNISIPEYQRAYTWKHKQVFQLLEDIKDCIDKKQGFYLLGTIILFKHNNNDIDIVDGQQRLTTLTLILSILGLEKFGLENQKYIHVESQNNLKSNYYIIKEWIENKELDHNDLKNFILDNVWFVQIDAPTQDEAFVFFDSQNSRGKPLEKYDLLKAHHLRYISDSNENVAKECTIFWENIDKSKRLAFLIYTLLGRTRSWSRKQKGNVDVLDEFKSQRISNKSDGFYKLNRYQQPPLFDKWRYIDREMHDKDDGLELVFRDIDAWQGTKRLKFVSESKKYMPFQITQPLEGGEQFFWFIEKYNQLYNDLFNPQNEEIPQLFKDLHIGLKGIANYNIGMSYILEVFESCCLFYYDKFGTDNLLEFSCYLEHFLSILRFRQSTVQYASINKFIQEYNVFAVINEAAFPEHIIRNILDNVEGKYNFLSNVEIEKGIRKSYFDFLYGSNGYYTINGSLLEHLIIMKFKKRIQTLKV